MTSQEPYQIEKILSTTDTWYGVSFSPDNTKLYASGGSPGANDIFQWDFSAANFNTSKISIGQSYFAQLQIGKDNNIYVSNPTAYDIHFIDSPNSVGTSCNFMANSISLLPDQCQFGFPAFPENYFDQTAGNLDLYFGYETSVNYGNSVQLFSGGTGTMSWEPSTGLDCSTCPDPIASPTQTTEYIVTYDNGGVGCPIHKIIKVIVAFKPEIPNIFTPNGDNLNDTFFINDLPPNSKLEIFNRWGNLLYESQDYKNNWTYSTDGVYYYLLELTDGQLFKGFVQITDAR
ncbi:MAG: gliding motility-associated C-terminal domain-containing protein [Bacteroidota bacterium]|nr:gliding motility-associated C-terminal domain-containing protein [Bacteroidota bacterium]